MTLSRQMQEKAVQVQFEYHLFRHFGMQEKAVQVQFEYSLFRHFGMQNRVNVVSAIRRNEGGKCGHFQNLWIRSWVGLAWK